jgi:hypothetical protein
VPCLLNACSGNYRSSTGYVSGRDIGFDYASKATQKSTIALLGSLPATTQMGDIKTQYLSVLNVRYSS